MQLAIDKYGIYRQHLQNMTEDKSFKATDQQKFRGWLKKWRNARLPISSCLFVEILSPTKSLSLAFQSEDINPVYSISQLEKAKRQLHRLERKDYEDLPTVKRFLDKVVLVSGKYEYQNVLLHEFATAKDFAQRVKNELLQRIKVSLESRLEVAENRYVLHAATILNTEGWEKHNDEGNEDDEFADKCVSELFDQFKDPLNNAGFNGTFDDLLQQ